MKVCGDFLWPPHSTDKTSLILKVSKGAKIRKSVKKVSLHIVFVTFLSWRQKA